VKVIAVLRSSGDNGRALSEIVDAVNPGEIAALLVPASPDPPLLEATTENV
jgi:hypothetical protein